MIASSLHDLSDSARQERVDAIAAFGFTDRQARFLVRVLVHAGVFVERQYCAFARITHGQKSHDFVAQLVGRGYATAIVPGALHRGRLFHVQFKPFYEAIGEPDNRHRKPGPLGRLIERVMILDGILADTGCTWLGTEQDKLAYFIVGLLKTRLEKLDYPHLTFGQGDRQTVRYFPDKLPIGVEGNGGRRHVFLYLVRREVPVDFRMFLYRHAELLRALDEWTIRLLIPRRFRKAATLYRFAVRDEYATPLKPSTVEELEWFFHKRSGRPQSTPPPLDLDLVTAARQFSAARFRALHRAWRRDGDPALWAAQSHVLRDALERGDGRIEFVDLSRQYLHLTPLVGVA
jgi:hypothetical protein